MDPNDNMNQFFYDRLMLFAEDHNADVMFYTSLWLHLQGSDIPDHDFMEILVLRDSVTGERIFPSKETAFQHLQQRIQYHTRARDEFVRLAQIIHRVAVVQGRPVERLKMLSPWAATPLQPLTHNLSVTRCIKL